MSQPTPDSEPQFDADAQGTDPVSDMQEAEKAMEQLQKERDELFARLARVSADYQNSMKRAEQNLTSTIDISRGDTLRMFIPVLDHFDTALSTPAQSDDAKALAHGLQIVRDELLKVLQQSGVERVTVNVGDAFDPHIHEAMLRQLAAGVKPNHVAMILAPGYIYKKSRTLRPAKVAVAPE